jgi:hypothetical protein
MYDPFAITWKKAVLAYFRVLWKELSKGNHSVVRVECWTSERESRTTNHNSMISIGRC